MAVDTTDLIEHEGDDDSTEDVGLEPRQIEAMERLDELGETMPEWDDEEEKWNYSSDSRVRALQLVAQGRLGGPGRGQGRKPVKAKLAEELAVRVGKKADKMEKAIDKALNDDNARIAMDAVRLSVDIQSTAVKQRQAEERHEAELESLESSELIDEIFNLISDPLVEAALSGRSGGVRQSDLTLPAGEVQEVNSDDSDSDSRGAGSAPRPRNRVNGAAREARRGASSPDSGKPENPWTKAARRRAAD